MATETQPSSAVTMTAAPAPPASSAAAAAPLLAPGPVVKHPLQHKWTMWFDPPVAPTKKTDWASALKRVVDFEFVEDFWGMFNNVVQPTKLAPGSNYHMFKFGIEPKWEDVQNMRGGKWVLSLAKTSPVGFDNLWLNALLACIGEQFGDQSAQICGLVASPRPKFDRLSLWTSQSSDTAGVREIGLALRRELELPETLKINYQYHQDSLEKGTGQTATHMEL